MRDKAMPTRRTICARSFANSLRGGVLRLTPPQGAARPGDAANIDDFALDERRAEHVNEKNVGLPGASNARRRHSARRCVQQLRRRSRRFSVSDCLSSAAQISGRAADKIRSTLAVSRREIACRLVVTTAMARRSAANISRVKLYPARSGSDQSPTRNGLRCRRFSRIETVGRPRSLFHDAKSGDSARRRAHTAVRQSH